MTDADGTPARRRRRARRAAGSPASGAEYAETGEAGEASGFAPQSSRNTASGQPRHRPDRDPARPGGGHDPDRGGKPDRGWRELAGSAPSQVGISGAMRARDVARPTAADLAEAERTVNLVRRQWQPPAAGPDEAGV